MPDYDNFRWSWPTDAAPGAVRLLWSLDGDAEPSVCGLLFMMRLPLSGEVVIVSDDYEDRIWRILFDLYNVREKKWESHPIRRAIESVLPCCARFASPTQSFRRDPGCIAALHLPLATPISVILQTLLAIDQALCTTS